MAQESIWAAKLFGMSSPRPGLPFETVSGTCGNGYRKGTDLNEEIQ